jgi:hypothetical protein
MPEPLMVLIKNIWHGVNIHIEVDKKNLIIVTKEHELHIYRLYIKILFFPESGMYKSGKVCSYLELNYMVGL